MDDIHTIAPERGLAADAEGKLLDMPRGLAHTVSGDLLDVATLLHASMREAGSCSGGDEDDDAFTSSSSRAVALIAMADEKVRSVLRAISAYV
jgi:hypothetical protein